MQAKLINLIAKASISGKVLDVSNMNDHIIGYKTIVKPQSKSTKKYVEGIAIVSDNYAAYEMTMNILGPNYMHFAESYLNYYGQLELPPLISDIWIYIMKLLNLRSLKALLCVSQNFQIICKFHFLPIIQYYLNLPLKAYNIIQQNNLWKLFVNHAFINNIYFSDCSKGFIYIDNNGHLSFDYYNLQPEESLLLDLSQLTFKQILGFPVKNKVFLLLLSHDEQVYIVNEKITPLTIQDKIIHMTCYIDDNLQLCFITQKGKIYIGSYNWHKHTFVKKLCSTKSHINIIDAGISEKTLITVNKDGIIKLCDFKKTSVVTIMGLHNIYRIFVMSGAFFTLNNKGESYFVLLNGMQIIPLNHPHFIVQIVCDKNIYGQHLLLDNTGVTYFVRIKRDNKILIVSTGINNVIQIHKNYLLPDSNWLIINNENVLISNVQTFKADMRINIMYDCNLY